MPIAPFHLSLLAGDNLHSRRRVAVTVDADDSAHLDTNAETARATQANSSSHGHHSRSSRHRVTSHHNAFQTTCSVFNDPPPTYAIAAKTPSTSRCEGRESLPEYSCSVQAEGKLLLNLESVSPLSPIGEGDWRELYTVLRGTLLSFYRLKDGGPGKLLRSYTLQHAEVGLAADTEHIILVPQSRLAHLIPHGARRRAWQKDPDLFKPVRQTILRLRAETDQLLLADADEERIHALIYAISAAIDIAQPIDERSVPKQCTVPRRRRRQQRPRPLSTGDLADPALLAEQERIFRQMFPRFAETAPEAQIELSRTVTSDVVPQSPTTPAREEEEIDFSMIREESAASANTSRPQTGDHEETSAANRTITTTTTISTYYEDMTYATPQTNFTPEGKWQPPHNRSPAQVQRYIKRCMPVLNVDAHRASDIVINHGKRMKINWRMELLEEWELQPPSYKAHKFDQDPTDTTTLARANSQRSTAAGSAANQSSPSTSATVHDEDQITQADQALEHLQLTKMASNATTPKGDPSDATLHAMASLDPKGRSPEQLAREIHGVVFCF